MFTYIHGMGGHLSNVLPLIDALVGKLVSYLMRPLNGSP